MPGQSVAAPDRLHRFVRSNDLEYDHDLARWVPTKRAFKRDPDGLSVYSERILTRDGLNPIDVCRNEKDVVYAVELESILELGLIAMHDPESPSVRKVDPAHCLVTTASGVRITESDREELRAQALHSAGQLPPAPPKYG